MANDLRIIELDCPPGSPRPGDLIGEVVKGTILEAMSEAQPDAAVSKLFGNWIWAFAHVTTPEQWEQVQKVIEPRIRKLYAAGVIRYGSW